jgi:hypothetical protein
MFQVLLNKFVSSFIHLKRMKLSLELFSQNGVLKNWHLLHLVEESLVFGGKLLPEKVVLYESHHPGGIRSHDP